MNAFLIELENRPGALARVAEAIAARGINITTIAGSACGSAACAVLATNDDAGTREALAQIGYSYQEREITQATLGHVPGTLAQATRRLGDAGINIEAVVPMGMHGNDVMVGFVTDQPARARELIAGATSASR